MRPLIIPLSGGGEFRLMFGPGECDVQTWHCYPDGRAMMGGGVRLSTADLRLLCHAARVALWALERAEGIPPGLRCAA